MSFTNPQVSDFKAQFIRDFPYGTDPAISILDQDILNAFAYSTISINPGLFPDQNTYFLGYLLLSAHRLVMNIRASSQGLNGQFNWAQTQKAVAGVSESFQVPERIQNNPELMMLSKTNYGAQYLELVLPFLCGQAFTVCGRTKP
jgi:hypothetical protein